MAYSVILGSFVIILVFLFTDNEAPYGRYANTKLFSTVMIDARLAWVIMESPLLIQPIWYLYFAADTTHLGNTANIVLNRMFIGHVLQR